MNINNPSACLSIARALFVDPFYQAVTIDFADNTEKQLSVLADYCQLALNEAANVGEVRFVDGLGGAIWLTTEFSEEEVKKQSKIRTDALSQLLGNKGFNNYINICDSMSENLPEELNNKWYLSILGIDPGHQGQGLGTQLLNVTLERADKLNELSYIETFTPKNIPFYEKLGYVKTQHCNERVTGSDYWIMVREPK